MTSRERVTIALSHKEPDKIPVDCGGMRSTGMLGATYNRLKQYLGIKTGETKIYDMVQQLALVEDWFLEQFRIDVVDLARAFADDPEDWNDWVLPDGSSCKVPSWMRLEKEGTSWFVLDEDDDQLAEMPSGSYFFDQKIWPYLGKTDTDISDLGEKLKKIMWVSMADPMWRYAGKPDFYGRVHAAAKKLHEETDYSIMAGFGGQFFELGSYIFRNDEFMMNMYVQQELTGKVLDRLLEMHLEGLRKLLPAIDGYVDTLVFGDDLGTQSGPMLSPRMYRDLILPRARQIYQYTRENSNIKVFLHSCGAIYEFLPDLIDAGIEIINPVQTSAVGMEPEKLKREFGRDLVFWGGGIDTQHILPEAGTEEVKKEVDKNCRLLMPDGGFIFNQIHNMLDTVPPENIITMYEAVNSICY